MEYPVVIMTLVKSHGKNLLQRNLVYTALTRAKKKVIVVGSETAFISAIENDEIQQRNTDLSRSIVRACSGEDLLAPLRLLSPTAANARRISTILEGDLKTKLMRELAESEDDNTSYEIDENGKFIDNSEPTAEILL
jgi:ATP-dependent exoDNAse (exonuclease V) beta subunit